MKIKNEPPIELVTKEEDYLSLCFIPSNCIEILAMRNNPEEGELITGGEDDMRINVEVLKQLAESLEEHSVGELTRNENREKWY